MKWLIYFLCTVFTVMVASRNTNAQLLKRVKDAVKNSVENKAANDAGNAADRAVDKAEDAIRGVISGKDTNDDPNNQDNNAAPPAQQRSSSENASVGAAVSVSSPASLAVYKNYDFVPGNKILFTSNLEHQKDAELPARLGTLSGTAEVQTYNGDKVIILEKGDNISLLPVMNKADYLPEQFTIAFDLLPVEAQMKSYNSFYLTFFKPDVSQRDMKYRLEDTYNFEIEFASGTIDFGPTIDGKRLREEVAQSLKTPGKWHHIAIYIHHNVGKAYIDQYRVAASNMMPGGVTKLAIQTDGDAGYMIKNFRIAAGGSDAYQKIISEGKFVTHGIHFASGKAVILPESMGTINEMYNVLKNHQELKLEVNGYTDSDGSTDFNLQLSRQRAEAVKAQLTEMGIDAGRLTTKGLGESNPIDANSTPEGKANNRRVEFVKM